MVTVDTCKFAHRSVTLSDIVFLRVIGIGTGGAHRVYFNSLKYIRSTFPRPCVVTEIGVPNVKNERDHELLVEAHMRALERNLLSFAWWHYAPHNCAQHGDHWNDENFSIVTRSRSERVEQDDRGCGGSSVAWRIERILARPVVSRVAGTPTSFSFSSTTSSLHFEYFASQRLALRGCETVIELPQVHYPTAEQAAVDVEHVSVPSRKTHRQSRSARGLPEIEHALCSVPISATNATLGMLVAVHIKCHFAADGMESDALVRVSVSRLG